MMWWLGLALSVVGYLLAIWGAWLLYRNASPDLGQLGSGVVPLEFRQMMKGFDEEDTQEIAKIDHRRNRNKQGFGLIVIGCVLQLAGTVVSALT